jgi:hypothetical protein
MQCFFAVQQLKPGAYLVEFAGEKQRIWAADSAGCFYAVQSVIEQLGNSANRGFVLAAVPRGSSGLKLYLP